MNLWQRLKSSIGKNAGQPAPDDDFWYRAVNALENLSGVDVTEETALRASAVYACVKILSETVASLPFRIYERIDDRRKRIASEHYLYKLLHRSPNPRITAYEYWETSIAFAALWGTAYSRIVPDRFGQVGELKPIHPKDIKSVSVTGSDQVMHRITEDAVTRTVGDDVIFRIPGLSFDGITGIAPTVYANDPIALALTTEAFGTRLFTRGLNPGGILSHPNKLGPDARQRLSAAFEKMFAGIRNSGKLMVLEEGMKYEKMSFNPEEAQSLETRVHQIREIARFFRVPLHMLADLERSSFSNIEHQSLEFVKYTIMPWVVRIEQRINKDLIDDPDRYYAKFAVEGLLRGDSKSRAEFYRSGILDGWLSRNEVRELEDLDPIDGLDTPLMPLNMSDGRSPPTQESSIIRSNGKPYHLENGQWT